MYDVEKTELNRKKKKKRIVKEKEEDSNKSKVVEVLEKISNELNMILLLRFFHDFLRNISE